MHVSLNVIWDWEAPAGGGDTHFAVYRGTKARIEARQTKADGYKPEVYIVPNRAADAPAILAAAKARDGRRQPAEWPGVGAEMNGAEIKLVIPDALRVGHEAHFAQVTSRFLIYLRDRTKLPAWERPNMLAKYTVTTLGTEMSRNGPGQGRAAHRAALVGRALGRAVRAAVAGTRPVGVPRHGSSNRHRPRRSLVETP